MIAALFKFIEVVLSIIFDATKKFVGAVLLAALLIMGLFFASIVSLIYILA